MVLIFCGEVRQVIENLAALKWAKDEEEKFVDWNGKKLYKCAIYEELQISYLTKVFFTVRMALEHRSVTAQIFDSFLQILQAQRVNVQCPANVII